MAVAYLDLQPMLRIAAACKDDGASIKVWGELLGLEIEPNKIEITNCVVTRNRRDTPSVARAVDTEDKAKKEMERIRLKFKELLDYTDADCQSLGWFQVMPPCGLCDSTLVEELYRRTTTVDHNSMILCFDYQKELLGQFPFRAFQLDPSYCELRKKIEVGELNANAAKHHKVLTEIVVKVKPSVANDAVLAYCADYSQTVEHAVHATYAHQRVRALTNMGTALEELAYETDKVIKYQKDNAASKSLRRPRVKEATLESVYEDAAVVGESSETVRAPEPDLMKAHLLSQQVWV